MQNLSIQTENEVLELDIELAKYQYATNNIGRASSAQPSAH